MQSKPKLLKTKFERDPRFNSAHIFKYSFGITLDTVPQKIVLSFLPRTGQYVLSKPMHVSQKVISETDKEVIISLLTYETPELWRKILSYGPGIIGRYNA